MGVLSTNLNDVLASLCFGKILEMAETSLICIHQCSTPRDPAIRRNQQRIARASVCLMCALQNRVPKASVRNSLPAESSTRPRRPRLNIKVGKSAQFLQVLKS